MNSSPDIPRGSDKSVWDAAASSYDAERAADPVYHSCMDRALALLAATSARCLDAGCGTGLATGGCLSRSRLVVAMDFSASSLALLRARFAGLPVLALQGDVTALPFADGAFDQVICANTLQHIRHGGPQARAIDELRRVTARGGRVVVSVHHFSRQKRQAGWIKEGKPGQPGIDYIFRFTRGDLRALLGDAHVCAAGFYSLNRLRATVGVQNWMSSLFGGLAARLGLGHMLIAVTSGTGSRR
jgi:SAM-dependent methyltransferase